MISTIKIKRLDPHVINTDLKLINNYLKKEFQPTLNPRNTRELSIILKNKTAQHHITKDQKKSCQEWLNQKGIKMEPILTYLHQKKKESEAVKDEISTKFQLSKNIKIYPTLFNQQEFLIKKVNHSINSQFKNLATKRKIQIELNKKISKRFNICQNEFMPAFKSNLREFDHKKSRDHKKLKQYMQLIVNLTKKHRYFTQSFNKKHWAQYIYENIDHKLWKIMYHQLNEIDFQESKSVIMNKLIINSLSLIKNQFNQELPINLEGITYFLQEKYLSKFQSYGQYILDPQEGCFWGRAFLYYRAGRHKQLKALLHKLNQKTMIQQIRASQQKIKRYEPQKAKKNELKRMNLKERDVFRQQIIYTLTGQNKYSSNILSNPLNLDGLWIFLRTTGIYYRSNQGQYEQIRSQMIKFYNQNISLNERIYFLAYLIDYDGIIDLEYNEIVDKDDYLHLLILLKQYPNFVNNFDHIVKKLIGTIASFVAQCQSDSISNQVQLAIQCYLLQIPGQYFIQHASTIIVENKLYQIISWDYYKEYFEYQKDYYEAFLMEATKKYVQNTAKYLQGAQTFFKRTNTENQSHICSALDMIIRMLIKNSNQSKISNGSQIQRALQILTDHVKDSEQIHKKYYLLLILFENQRAISKYRINRNLKKIKQFLTSQKSLTFFTNLDYNKLCMIQKLIQLKGIDVLFIYMSKLMKAADYYYSDEDINLNGKSFQLIQLKKYRYEILKLCKNISQHQQFSIINHQPSFITLINQLQEQIL